MMQLDPHVALLIALTSGAGLAMTRLGLGIGLLRERAARRRCVSCGRVRGRHGCEHCGL